jgi:MFS family permease
MLFAHATALAEDRELSLRAAGLAVSALAAGNLIGRLIAGACSDRMGRVPTLTGWLTTGAASIGVLALPTPSTVVLVGFLGTGLAYGAVSALVPAATADRVGPALFATAYGVVLTGWGCAGLLAPVAGGPLLRLAAQNPAVLGLAALPPIAAGAALLALAHTAEGR